METKKNTKHKVLPFLLISLTVLSFGLVVFYLLVFEPRVEQRTITSLAGMDAAAGMEKRIKECLSPAHAFATLIRQFEKISDFDALAADMLRNNDCVNSIQLAPNGVVQYIYPLEGNEVVLGQNLLKDPDHQAEISLAIESKELTLDGPYELAQGGQAVVGRLPVYVGEAEGKQKFWGFTIVVIRLSALIQSVELKRLTNLGYAYEISRILPHSGKELVFSRSHDFDNKGKISFDIRVPNALWTLSVIPITPSPSRPLIQLVFGVTLLLSVIGVIFICLLQGKNKNIQFANTSIWPPLGTLLAMIAVIAWVWVLERVEKERHNQTQRAEIMSQLGVARAKLETALSRRIYLTEGLVAYVSKYPEITNVEFTEFAKRLLKDHSAIQSIQLAKNSEVSFVYPLVGNEAVLGLKLLEIPEQQDAVRRAIETKKTVVAGPINLVQGGLALISRTPIYLMTNDQAKGSNERYWGLATVVINERALFEEAGIYDEFHGIQFGIRGRDGLGEQGEIFFGSSAIFTGEPVVLDVDLPNGSWQIAAAPIEGHFPPPAGVWWLRVGGILTAIVLGLLSWFLITYQVQLRESEQRLHFMVDNLPAGMIYVEEGSLMMNRGAERITGFNRDQISNVNEWFSYMCGAQAKKIQGQYEQDRMAGFPLIRTFSISDSQGVSRLIEFVGCKDQKGEIWLLQDITDRVRSEKALHLSQERLKAIIEKSPNMGIQVYDAKGHVLFWNHASEKIFGWSQEDVLGSSIGELFLSKESEKDFLDFLDRLDRSDTLTLPPKEWSFNSKDKRKGILLSSVFSIPSVESENTKEFIRMDLDITESKKIERELLRSQKLRFFSQFARNIAHDFNDLLTIILGNISVITHKDELSPSNLEEMNSVEEACYKAKELTKRLFSFTEEDTLIRNPVSLEELIHDVISLSRDESNINYELKIPKGLMKIDADKGQIIQVFQNLVENSVQAMPKGGTLFFEAMNCPENKKERPQSPKGKDGQCVKLLITDDGEGIGLENLPYVLDPMFTTRKNRSGLGLSVVYSIITNHGGTVKVRSKPGKGTTIEMVLPASKDLVSKVGSSKVKLTRGKGKILIMEDQMNVGRTYVRMLKELGYQGISSTDDDELIKVYQEAQINGPPFNAVILDLNVPYKLNGTSTLTKLKGINPEIKSIVSSGYSNSQVLENFKLYGFNGALVKPFNISQLSEILEMVLVSES